MMHNGPMASLHGIDRHLTLRERENDPIVIPIHSPGAYRTVGFGSFVHKERDNSYIGVEGGEDLIGAGHAEKGEE